MKAEDINKIFRQAILDYHLQDHIDADMPLSFVDNKFGALLYQKTWIDTVQWHLEDIIRNPKIAPDNLVAIKRRIDASNQDRTDIVELIDQYLYEIFVNIQPLKNAKLNSETPAWLLDRMSILQLKIYHFQEQIGRIGIDENHQKSVTQKLFILNMQEADLAQCYNELIEDIATGQKLMKLYKQMKMYNDPRLNPVLYTQNEN
jgi:Protein of unknown function (DUF4254)